MKTSQWRRHNGVQMIHVTLRWRHSSIGRRFDFYQLEATGGVWINFGSGGHFQWPFKFWIYILYGKVGPRIARTSLVCFRAGRKFIWIVSIGPWCASRHPPTMRAFTRLARLRHYDARIHFDLKMRAPLGMRAFANDAMRVFACWATNLAPWARPRRALALRAIALAIALALWARISTH